MQYNYFQLYPIFVSPPVVAPPLNIILSIENSTSVRVTWNPPTGSSITGYKIQYYIRMDNIFTSHFIGVPETSFIVRGEELANYIYTLF